MELITLSHSLKLSNFHLTAFFIFGAVEYLFRIEIIIPVCVLTAHAHFIRSYFEIKSDVPICFGIK